MANDPYEAPDGRFTLWQRLFLFLASAVGPLLILLYGLTWRTKWDGVENLTGARQARGKVLFAFWHCRLLGLCFTHRYRDIGIMVSRSFDGEWIARLVKHLGYRVFRGSASRDGAQAFLEMLRDYGDGDLSLTVDGPRGPAERVKPGVVTLAARSGLPIVPITYAASSFWRLKSWDRFIIPRPFATVTVRYGEPIEVPAEIDDDGRGAVCARIEAELNRMV